MEKPILGKGVSKEEIKLLKEQAKLQGNYHQVNRCDRALKGEEDALWLCHLAILMSKQSESCID